METPECFECPVCLDIPDGEIFQCKNGHLICATCSNQIRHCPQCRIPFSEGKSRNLAVESFLESMKVDCTNKVRGCRQRLLRKNLDHHLKICKHNDFNKRVRLCELFGFDCNFLFNVDDLAASIKHLTDSHPFLSHKGRSLQLKMMDVDTTCNLESNKSYLWTPLLIRDDDNVPLIILFTLFNSKDDTLSCVCIDVSNSADSTQYNYNEGRKYRVKISIKSLCAMVPDLKLLVPCVNPLNAAVETKFAPTRVSMRTMRSFFSNEDGLVNLTALIQETNPTDILNVDLRSLRLNAVPNEPIQILLYEFDKCQQANIISFGVNCDDCRATKLPKVIYHCLQCADYDLCSKCMGKVNIHREHIFGKIVTLEQRKLVFDKRVVSLKDNRRRVGVVSVLPSVIETPYSSQVMRYKCDGKFPGGKICDKTEIRYVCLQCPNYSLCTCCMELEEENVVPPHNTCENHIFCVVYTTEHIRKIKSYLTKSFAETGKGVICDGLNIDADHLEGRDKKVYHVKAPIPVQR